MGRLVVLAMLVGACRLDFDPLGDAAGAADSAMINCTTGTRHVVTMGHCYALHELGSNIAWDSARTACIADGGHLATYASSAEEAAVMPVLAPTDRTWIGMSDVEIEGTWLWIDAEPMSYTNWRGTEPNNGSGGPVENCGVNSQAATSWQWNDIACDGGINGTPNYLCEIEG